MFISIVYEIILWIAAIVSIPKLLYHYWFYGKYRQSLGKRFGFNFPMIKKGNRYLVWIHAVSVGETKAVAALVKRLKKQLVNPIILISSVTETGYAEARRSLSVADYFVFLPFDLNFIIKPIVKFLKPNLVIISETDFWYNFIKNCKKADAFIAVVNGKISKRSMKRFEKFPAFSNQLFSMIDLACVQSHHYQYRFEQIGVPKAKIIVTGNLKFDDEYPQLTKEQSETWRKQFKIQTGDFVCVIGSTHDQEEKLLLGELHKVWAIVPNLKVIIVPRHPERFNAAAEIIRKEKISHVRFSRLDQFTGDVKVILLDAMGLLRKCYQLADIAIVAGSYTTKVGGHNVLEPAWYGVPVIFGPYMHSQPELSELIKEYRAGLQIPIEELSKTLLELIQIPEKRLEIGRNGLKMLADINGATNRTWRALRPMVQMAKK